MGYSWAPWSLAALHGIEPYEVMQALTSKRRWPRLADAPGEITVLTSWARTRNGRPLIVAVHQSDEWDWLIVGARDMHLRERTEFVRWEETHSE